MKRKILFQIFALGLLLHFTACQIPDDQIGEGEGAFATGQWLAYNETQCADPWGYCNKTPDRKVCVQEYVEKQGYTVLEVTVSGETERAVCAACQCPSGRVFKVRVRESDVDKLLAAGFKKQ